MSRFVLSCLLGIVLSLIPSTLVLGAVFVTDDMVTISEAQKEDYYVLASFVDHSTTTHGDLFSISESMRFDGIVEEDMMTMTSVYDHVGSVGDDLYLFVQQANFLDGEILGDLFLFAEEASIGPDFVVHGECFIMTQSLRLQGEFGACRIVTNSLWVDATFEDNVMITAQSLDVGPNTRFLRDVSYASPTEKDLSAFVTGDVYYRQSLLYSVFVAYMMEAWTVYHMIFTVLCSLLLLVFFPRLWHRMTEKLLHHTLGSIVAGMLWYLLVPLIILVLLFSLVGIPLALLLLCFYVLSVFFFEVLIVSVTSSVMTYYFFPRPALWSAIVTLFLVVSLSGLLSLIPYNLDVVLGVVVMGACLLSFGRD